MPDPNATTPAGTTPATTPATPEIPTTPTATPAPTPNPATPAAPVQVPEGYVSKTELDAILARATEAENKVREFETSQLTEKERIERERDEAIRERDTERGNARQANIAATAARLGFADASDAARFVEAGTESKDIEAALKTVLESKPYLRGQAATPAVTPTQPTSPARVEGLTMDAIKTMTPAELAKRMPEVMAALKASKAA